MGKDPEAWDPNDPDYKKGYEAGKAQRKAQEKAKDNGGAKNTGRKK